VKPRALLWDNDGVLVDTETLFFQATREVLEPFGVTIGEDIYVDFALRHGRSLFDLIAERGASRDEIARTRVVRDARYMDLLREGVTVLDGVRESLADLFGRIPMAIVTGSGRDHFEVIHESLGLLEYFDFALADGDYPRHKPKPDPYLVAAKRLGIDPGECLVVEDSERGLQSAVAAGMRCLVVPNGFSRGGNFESAHRVLTSASDVPSALEVLS
jgi:HAD superfamily hydrolase (TIGR01509 family)